MGVSVKGVVSNTGFQWPVEWWVGGLVGDSYSHTHAHSHTHTQMHAHAFYIKRQKRNQCSFHTGQQKSM